MDEDGIMLVDDEWVERWEAIEKAATAAVEDGIICSDNPNVARYFMCDGVLYDALCEALALPGKPCIIVPQVET